VGPIGTPVFCVVVYLKMNLETLIEAAKFVESQDVCKGAGSPTGARGKLVM